MDRISSMFDGITRSFSIRTPKNTHNSDWREAVESMAKDAKKNHDRILKNSGFINGEGSRTLVSVYSKRGGKGTNQDCCIVWEEFGCQRDMVFCGIFDGHGSWGHVVAKCVRSSLPKSLLFYWKEASMNPEFSLNPNDKLQLLNLWKHSFTKACAVVDQELQRNRRIDSFYSGSTALTAIRQGDNILLANVGDSRAVLATTSDEGNLMAVQLTVDFKPDLPYEAERIAECRGRIFCQRDEPGIHRVWRPHEEMPGLAMSRAFGDYCLKDFGLISVPEVVHRTVTCKDQFIILATDGVWDVISNQEAVMIVSTVTEREKSAKRLVESAAKAWKRKRRGIAMDDVSASVLFLQ